MSATVELPDFNSGALEFQMINGDLEGISGFECGSAHAFDPTPVHTPAARGAGNVGSGQERGIYFVCGLMAEPVVQRDQVELQRLAVQRVQWTQKMRIR